MAKRKTKKSNDPVTERLDQIKKLLMLQLVSSGVQAKSIATVLGVTKSNISAMVPARAIRKQGR